MSIRGIYIGDLVYMKDDPEKTPCIVRGFLGDCLVMIEYQLFGQWVYIVTPQYKLGIIIDDEEPDDDFLFNNFNLN